MFIGTALTAKNYHDVMTFFLLAVVILPKVLYVSADPVVSSELG